MHVCNSSVAGFRLILGTAFIHFGMFFTLCLRIPSFMDNSEYNDLKTLWIYSMILHGIALLITTLEMFPSWIDQMKSQALSLVGALVYVLLYIFIVIDLTENKNRYFFDQDSLSSEAQIAINWYVIEMIMISGIILSYVIILTFTFFKHIKFHLEQENRIQIAETDTIESEIVMICYYSTITAPLITTVIYVIIMKQYDLFLLEDQTSWLIVMIAIQVIQFISFTYFVFTDFRSGSVESRESKAKASVLLCRIATIVLPILQIILLGVNYFINKTIDCWLYANLFISSSFMVGAYISLNALMSSIMGHIDQFTKARPIAEYEKKLRQEGTGNIRINQFLDLRDDCYGYVVISMLEDHQLDSLLKFKEQDVIDTAIHVAQESDDQNEPLDQILRKSQTQQHHPFQNDAIVGKAGQKRKTVIGIVNERQIYQKGGNLFLKDDDFMKVDENEDNKLKSMSRIAQDKYYYHSRAKAVTTALMVWLCQILVAVCLILAVHDQKEEFSQILDAKQNFVRFVCAMMLHIQMQDELRQGMKIMKYANNHPGKFENNQWGIPFSAGLMQALMVVTIEIINLFNICTLATTTEIVCNYVALAIVADFDDFVFKAITSNDAISKLQSKSILKIEVTTSKRVNHVNDKKGCYVQKKNKSKKQSLSELYQIVQQIKKNQNDQGKDMGTLEYSLNQPKDQSQNDPETKAMVQAFTEEEIKKYNELQSFYYQDSNAQDQNQTQSMTKKTTLNEEDQKMMDKMEPHMEFKNPITLEWASRTRSAKIARVVYLAIRLLYIAFYFYFFQFLTLFLILYFPMKYYQDSECDGQLNCDL